MGAGKRGRGEGNGQREAAWKRQGRGTEVGQHPGRVLVLHTDSYTPCLPAAVARRTWGEGPTVDRKRKRLQEEKLALDDKGYLRADLRVSRIYHFDEVDLKA